MRKVLVPLLAFGLLLMGVTPALAAGKQVKAALPTQQDKVGQIVIPDGEQVSEETLSEVEGQGLIGALAGAIGGAIGGAVTSVVSSVLHHRPIDWKDVGAAAIGGAVGGAIAGAIAGP